MQNRWSEETASEFIAKYGKQWGEDLALRTYSSRLMGEENELVLHGGGNTSVKGSTSNIFGNIIPAIYVKASGYDLANIVPEGHTGLDLEYLKRLRTLVELSDDDMVNEVLTHRFNAHAATPSIESLMHAFLPPKYVDHTHADAILVLTNRPDGKQTVHDALGSDVLVIEYVRPGFPLARAVAEAYETSPASRGIVLVKHGLVTWGETARESYERTIELSTTAEKYIARKGTNLLRTRSTTPPDTAMERYLKVAPILRGLLAVPTGNPDVPFERFVILPLMSKEVLNIVDSRVGKEIALTPSITPDHLIRTKSLPMWIDTPRYDDEKTLREQISSALRAYATEYDAYVDRNSARLKEAVKRFDSMPRVILMPGLGALCAGKSVADATIARDITGRTLAAKTKIAAMGRYEPLSEEHLFDMEYFTLQHAKLSRRAELPLQRSIALVTGAAGAIGSGICQGLLEQGCHVAATDLQVDQLNELLSELKSLYGERVIGAPLDVTDPESVRKGFAAVIQTWGGVDLVIVNAGVAHVSSLEEMNLTDFQRLERVNVEGTLNVLSEAAKVFRIQGTGGDIVLVSTKNVFAPGARFGAYSATKAAAHQLARIASLELAEIGVRVNMVSPDAVFSQGKRKSGLWAEVGPDRMRARGLSEEGLQEYYRQRNLLKAKITAEHVARAVVFFAMRQTPTTGATLPVDGGLPDATPR